MFFEKNFSMALSYKYAISHLVHLDHSHRHPGEPNSTIMLPTSAAIATKTVRTGFENGLSRLRELIFPGANIYIYLRVGVIRMGLGKTTQGRKIYER